MLASASPLKPKVDILSKSSYRVNLLVAYLSQSSGKSFNYCFILNFTEIPHPLSFICIIFKPPPFITIEIECEPASIEFSSNSFIAFAGFSIISPAAILLITFSSNFLILTLK